MHQMELWQQFLEQEVLPLRNSKIQELHAYYVRHRQEIVQGIVPLFDTFCERVDCNKNRVSYRHAVRCTYR